MRFAYIYHTECNPPMLIHYTECQTPLHTGHTGLRVVPLRYKNISKSSLHIPSHNFYANMQMGMREPPMMDDDGEDAKSRSCEETRKTVCEKHRVGHDLQTSS